MVEIRIFQLGVLQTNCYLIFNKNEAVVIDPGGDPREVISFLAKNNLRLTHILNTHLHFDHIQGNAALANATGAPILANKEDEFLLQTEVGAGGFMDFPETEPFDFNDLREGETEFLGLTCQVLATPGHTPGSLSFYFPEIEAVFVGDLLFFRSIGRTDFPGGDFETLKKSAQEKIFTLPDDTIIYPGHGEETRVMDERLHNPFFHEVKII